MPLRWRRRPWRRSSRECRAAPRPRCQQTAPLRPLDSACKLERSLFAGMERKVRFVRLIVTSRNAIPNRSELLSNGTSIPKSIGAF
jgi:hypothetical protein